MVLCLQVHQCHVSKQAETQAEMQMPDHLEQHLNEPMTESRLHCMTQAVLEKLQLSSVNAG